MSEIRKIEAAFDRAIELRDAPETHSNLRRYYEGVVDALGFALGDYEDPTTDGEAANV